MESFVKIIIVRETLGSRGRVVRGVKILSMWMILILRFLLVLILTIQFSYVYSKILDSNGGFHVLILGPVDS